MCPMGGTSLFGWFELTGCKFDKEAAKLFLECTKNVVTHGGFNTLDLPPGRSAVW